MVFFTFASSGVAIELPDRLSRNLTIRDRAVGGIVGSFVADAATMVCLNLLPISRPPSLVPQYGKHHSPTDTHHTWTNFMCGLSPDSRFTGFTTPTRLPS